VYGDRRVFDPVQAYEFPAALSRRTCFCGYIANPVNRLALENFDWPFPPRGQRARPVVLASAGGGEDGFRILEAFVRGSANAAWQAMIVGGPMMPDADWAELQKLAIAHGVTCRSFVPHLSALFDLVDALVCMGGYNTLVEAAALGVPTVCVPRCTPRIEQLIRAEAFERLGLLQVCRSEHLSPESLKRKITDALRMKRAALRARAWAKLDFAGAERAAERLSTLALESVPARSG
jgi:predicted glycosyltransferase